MNHDVKYEVSDHKANPANDKLNIAVTDEKGAGGAHHRYEISGFDYATNDSKPPVANYAWNRQIILFQNGPIPEKGVNGVTHEALLAIVIDRLRSFQRGDYECFENANALKHIEEALFWLHKRTKSRAARGVEGTHEK